MTPFKKKLGYCIALGIIIFPLLQQNPIHIPQKKALLPPDLPIIPKKDNKLLKTLLAHNLWVKNHTKVKTGGEGQDQQENQQQTKKWQLQGIGLQQTGILSAAITANASIKIYYQGDSLPDGTTLEKITIDSITTTNQEGEEHYVHLFKDN